MLQIYKDKLLTTLKIMSHVDKLGVSPYVGILLDKDECHLYRSSVNSVVTTSNAPDITDKRWSFASYSHLLDCIKVVPSETIGIEDKKGRIHIRECGDFETDLSVHCTDRNMAGLRKHDVGSPREVYNSSWFGKMDLRSLGVTAPPMIMSDKLIAHSMGATVQYQGPSVLKTHKVSPRESFISIIPRLSDDTEITLYGNGYHGVETDGVKIFIAGHNLNNPLPYDLDQKVQIETFRADRVLYALESAVSMGENYVQFDPTHGVTTLDLQGNAFEFKLREVSGACLTKWSAFKMAIHSAKNIVTVLSQSTDSVVNLHTIPQYKKDLKYVLTRGPWSVVFGVKL